jgi:uncharacterized membrane protein YfhO
VQVEYGRDRVRYRIAAEKPILLVENEISFPGWTAEVAGATVDAVKVDDVFRGWRLPAGTYDLETRFRIPHFAALVAVSVTAWAAWLICLAVAARRQRRPRRA